MTAFEEHRFCPWEARQMPVDHVCVGDARIPCENRRDDGQVCGECGPCIAAQEADPRYRKTPDET